MKNCILVLGSDGYIGNALVQRLLSLKYTVIGVDNFSRRVNVQKFGSDSAINQIEPLDKVKKLKELGNFSFHFIDIAKESDKIAKIIERYKPDTIVNLAHMPSAAWSMQNRDYASYSLMNNILGTNNVLWAVKEYCPECHYITIGTTGEYQHDNNIDIMEGYFKMELNGRESTEMIFPRRPGSIYHCCYDDHTEILTNNGWKLFKNLSEDDTIATLNKKTDTLEYQKPSSYFEYNFNGDLISIQNKNIDLMITPNHNVFEHSNSKSDLNNWRLTKAEDIFNKNCAMRKSVSKWNGEDLKYWTIDDLNIDIYKWIKFFGWWITKGSLHNNNIIISQQNYDNFKNIVNCLSTFNSPQIFTNGPVYPIEFSIEHDQLLNYLYRNFDNRYIPKEMKQLSMYHLNKLLNTLLKSSGHIDNIEKFSATFYSMSKQLADDVQEISLKCGYSAIIENENYGYKVIITENLTTQLNKKSYSKESYNGKVYCCEVPNSIIYVRRNGKPVWCGNSKTASTYLIDFLTRAWDLYTTDIMQAVVFGSYTDDIKKSKMHSRFDVDECFIKGTPLFTPIGKFNIEDIKIDDFVYTHKGNAKKVKKTIINDYNGNIYNVKLQNNLYFSSTPRHPFYVTTKDNEPSWVSIEDIYTHQNKNDIFFMVPITNHVGEQVEIDITDEKYCIVNDGCVYPNKLKIDKLFCLLFGYYISDEMNNSYNDPMLPKLFKKMFKDKCIPDIFFKLPNDHIKELIKWYWKGNGCYSFNDSNYLVSMSSASLKLLEQVQLLLLRFGIMSTVNKQDCELFDITITDEYARIFLSDIADIDEITYSESYRDYMYIPIDEISISKYDGKVYNFEIEDDESYMVPVAAHNCFGTVINRFICQAKSDVPLTIYGNGDHKRGFLSLNDSIQALMIAINNKPQKGRVQVWNQLSEWHSMNDIAKIVKSVGSSKGYDVRTMKIKTPRNETTNDHYYNYKTDILKSLGYKPSRTIKQEVEYCFDIINKMTFTLPKITWK